MLENVSCDTKVVMLMQALQLDASQATSKNAIQATHGLVAVVPLKEHVALDQMSWSIKSACHRLI